ncbi:MAG: hypothetical protein ACE5NA_02395 [Nitrospiraceae bacterium]
MTENEINRAVQYVTASTSYGRDTVAEIIKTGLSEMTTLATTSTCMYDRDTLMEYVSRWTISRTGYPEPLVREVLGCAGRWLDEMYATLSRSHPDLLREPEG